MVNNMCKNHVSGLLYSQVGYDLGEPKRIIVRGHSKNFLPENSVMRLMPARKTEMVFEAGLKYWGEIWGSFWWVADFSVFEEPGKYDIVVSENGNDIFFGEDLKIGESLLWNSTWHLAAIDQLERRAVLAKSKIGWNDAGCAWQEVNTHSSMILGLCDALSFFGKEMDAESKSRILKQIANGCAYMAACQDKARELGYGEGPLSHDIIGHENHILPGDTSKALVTWAKLAQIPDCSEIRSDCLRRAKSALIWLMNDAKPLGAKGYSKIAHGATSDYIVPDEWSTNDLIMFCWGAYELSIAGIDYKKACADFARQIASRQVTEKEKMDGLWGHFYSFSDRTITEKAWTHSLEGEFGSDAGATYPFYIIPLIEMCRKWPDHEDASLWKKTVADFAYGFFLPACSRNPFFLLPLGIYDKEGLIWFAGLWHGMNAAYGLAAALALELEKFFSDKSFHEIAIGNLQWIAGLNAGLTRESLVASVITSMDIPAQTALPVSMICGVGSRWAGTWLNTRGVICNGFSTGHQFKFDVEPKKENDGPFTFTDEDWIPHSAGWLSGTSRLVSIPLSYPVKEATVK